MVLLDEHRESVQKIPRVNKALIGGFCGMLVTAVVHPLDLVKVRMQVYPSAKTTTEMARLIIRCEGYQALYSGLSAGLLRQATYTTMRIGVFYWLYEEYKKKYGIIPNLSDKMAIGACAGLAGAFAGNPSEVILVRMMADGKRDPCGYLCLKERRYRGLLHAIYKISTTEGPRTLWRGGTLTLTRSVFVSFAQIGTYTKVRKAFLERDLAKGTLLHLYTSVISSFFTAIMTLPVDLVKTRWSTFLLLTTSLKPPLTCKTGCWFPRCFCSSSEETENLFSLRYQFTRDCETSMTQREVFDDILKNKGVTYFWKGFLPYFIRLSVHTSLTYLMLDIVNDFYIKHRN